MANESAFAALDRMISFVRETPTLADEAMPDVAARVGASWRADLEAGRDPDSGVPWAPRKKDGGEPMKNAASKAVLNLAGRTITLSVAGPDAIHHYGVRGAEPRHVVPTGSTIPMKIGTAIRLGLFPVWNKRLAKVGGG